MAIEISNRWSPYKGGWGRQGRGTRPRFHSTPRVVPKQRIHLSAICAFWRQSQPSDAPILASAPRPAQHAITLRWHLAGHPRSAKHRGGLLRTITGETAADRRHMEPQLSGNRTRGKAPAMSGRGRDVFSRNSLWWAFFHSRRTGWITPRNRPTLPTKRGAISLAVSRTFYRGENPRRHGE